MIHPEKDFDKLDPKRFIIIKGARVNNLKNLSVAIPRNKLVVVTGLSGSGKSSLAFDTLFAEGQRMYVESLSSYARQFLGRMEKPEVDYIRGVAPAIAIEQKVNTRNPRSTVGTSTEIYDYLRLLFARVGKTFSPVSGNEVTKHSVTDVVEFVASHEEGTRMTVLAPFIIHEGRTLEQELNILMSKGYTRLSLDGEPVFIEDLLADLGQMKDPERYRVLIDRLSVTHDSDDFAFRTADSVQTAFFEGAGICEVEVLGGERREFSDKFELDGLKFEEPSVNLFTFNNPYGACKTCEGFGSVIGIDADLVIPNKSKSVYDGAIAPWQGATMGKWGKALINNSSEFGFPVHRPYCDLTEDQKELIWTGNKYFKGLNAFFKHLESKKHKIQYRVMLSRYRGRTSCPDCHGTRLRKDAGFVKINGKSIIDLVLMPVSTVGAFFRDLKLSDHDYKIAKRLLKEVVNRLEYLERVGLGYLTLNRLTSTLSGGEYQRIKLATSLGSALVGSMYILDEPSIGLHPRDTERLVGVLKTLRDLGNTVIVVEHEEEVMLSADQIIDIGPDAGAHGGELMFQGTLDELRKADNTYTARYLNGTDSISIPEKRRPWKYALEVRGARENNLKNIDVKFPLNTLTVVTGVSGSGKSTLVKKLLYPGIGKILEQVSAETGKMEGVFGDVDKVTHVEFVDQNPIGKSSRSNPVTYVKAYDSIRALFAAQTMAKQRGYKPAHFSFNVEGGRCEVCEGEGTVTVEMQFMADLHLTCESCKGKRFKQEVLDVKYKGKDISEVLELTVEEAIEFFSESKAVRNKLKPLMDVGLGYICLGQSANSLSGGEAQRVKLAFFLGKGQNARNKDHVLFIFDEPTTGLHFHDIRKLLDSINALVNHGSSAVIIEHNPEVVKSADWIIDLGPEGGDEGGYLNFEGTPEEMVKLEDNYTARFLKGKV
ncbi:UvrABC system protein A [Fulvitalea axinellae]|uniref:UvrABC system protein A n=1 Tax=Fulvitalea axinellae TaxID=1182444 RepID=A0AAU9CQD1_9BACT|nr:UvrABC system protein A [Fulvitalea axinellae]